MLIKIGSKDATSVKAIKARLNALGFTNPKLDENNPTFGIGMEAAVKAFQKSKNLIQDGEVGDLTWERLFVNTAQKQQDAPISQTLSGKSLQIAQTQLYVREKTNNNDGVDVEKYLGDVGLGKGYSWCAAFVYWCFDEAAHELDIANPLIRTAGVLNHWNLTKGQKVANPKAGDIFIMDFGKGQGHTGIVKEIKGDRMYTIEGNTAADPKYKGEDREGNGVFERNRSISSAKGFIRY